MSVIIEEITRQHNRKAFDCGIRELNQFLQQQARQKNMYRGCQYLAVSD